MGVDYSSVSGFGILLTDEHKKTLGFFEFMADENNGSEEDFFDSLEINYALAGNFAYTGNLKDLRVYFIVSGKTLSEVSKNSDSFIKNLSELGIEISKDDLIKISDTLEY